MTSLVANPSEILTIRSTTPVLPEKPGMKLSAQIEPMFVHADRAQEAMAAFARAEANEPPTGQMHPLAAMEAAYGVDFAMDKPFAFAAGFAFISVSGYLMHRSTASWGYVTGYDAIRSQMAAALADDDVTHIVMDVNSGGGMCAGCFELADWIYAQRGKKPIEAIVDAAAYSAAYALASCADRITITPTGGAGSIGVVAAHWDISGAMERYGEKVTFIYAGKAKVDGNQYQALSPRAKARLQAQVDTLYSQFVATVARNRGISEEAVRSTEAEVFTAAEAVAAGLADAVMAPQTRLTALFSAQVSTTEDLTMSTPGQETAPVAPAAPVAAAPEAAPVSAPAQAPAAVDAVTSERERIAAILKLPEAEGRSDLASHFALSTDLSVEQAQAALAVAPVASVAPAAAPAPVQNSFAAAMENTGNPDVGAGAPAGGNDEDPAKRILAAYSVATNTKLK